MEWSNNSGGLYAIFNGGNTSISNNTNIIGFGGEGFVAGDESMPVRVMTEEQVEDLRKQICAFGVISERLVEMHRRNMFPQQEYSYGETSHGDPLMLYGHKITARQRWNPTAKQLEILDSIFNRGKTTTPTKQKIKEIAAELAQHGPISENNVYNWFQNRRARCKRKQAVVGSSRGKKARGEEGNLDMSPESVANNTENVGASRTDDIKSSESSG